MPRTGPLQCHLNRDLSALCRAFTLAVEDRRIPSAPRFRKLKEAPPRKGFVEEADYRALVGNVHELWLRGLLAVAYNFGLRKSELLNLGVRQVDLEDRILRLDPGETKNNDGRLAVMTKEVYLLLHASVVAKRPTITSLPAAASQSSTSANAGDTLVREAGSDGLLLDDLRRSAVRNDP